MRYVERLVGEAIERCIKIKMVASICFDFVKQLRLFTERPDILNIQPCVLEKQSKYKMIKINKEHLFENTIDR